jgi:hypothetical protein
MTMNRVLIFSALASLLLFTGCGKEEVITDVPSIKVISMTPETATKDSSDVVITIEYTDGNGDLGENAPDVKNLFVTDSRNGVTRQFRIPQLAPDNANIIIRGNLDINMPPQGFVDDNQTTETTTFSIYVTDRAGNNSNTVQTPTLTINK